MSQENAVKELAWSPTDENYRFSTLAELLATHGQLEAGAVVFFGEVVRPTNAQFVDADEVIDAMANQADDLVGEYADAYPDVSKEAKAELQALLEAWAEKHCTVTFYTVGNIRQHVITEADLAAVVSVK